MSGCARDAAPTRTRRVNRLYCTSLPHIAQTQLCFSLSCMLILLGESICMYFRPKKFSKRNMPWLVRVVPIAGTKPTVRFLGLAIQKIDLCT